TERDATSWSKGKLRELLVGIAMEIQAGCCVISELKQVEGTVKESCVKHKGLIEVPSAKDAGKKKGDGDILKDLVKTTGATKVREALGKYLKALKTGRGIPCVLKSPLSIQVDQASPPVTLGIRIPIMALHLMEVFNSRATVHKCLSHFSIPPLVIIF
uniref:AHA1, activator of heat shock protein ATPase 2 n=1 Tax=Jaculus jaculus TaxID=51337 RepID=A0A8C5KLK2_JACJA